jgi:uncharacterized protein (TIGR02271 family)
MHRTIDTVRLDDMRGAPVYDSRGEKIGSVDEIFYDTGSNRPEWIGIGTGFFGTKRVLVPVEGASLRDDGICVAYGKDQVKDSPDVDGDEISSETERTLYRHYGIGGSDYGPTDDDYADTRGTAEQALTRSEEELNVGTRRQQVGSVRLRKWVETEPVAMDVELQRETARVVREPLDSPAVDAGDAFREEEVEVELREERPVVEKQVVAKERVGIEKQTERRNETIREDLRKEHIEVDDDQGLDRR